MRRLGLFTVDDGVIVPAKVKSISWEFKSLTSWRDELAKIIFSIETGEFLVFSEDPKGENIPLFQETIEDGEDLAERWKPGGPERKWSWWNLWWMSVRVCIKDSSGKCWIAVGKNDEVGLDDEDSQEIARSVLDVSKAKLRWFIGHGKDVENIGVRDIPGFSMKGFVLLEKMRCIIEDDEDFGRTQEIW